MTLAELIDFERALTRDRDRPLARLVERDQRIAATLPHELRGGDALFSHWLSQVRDRDRESAGARVERLLGVAALILFGAGVALGVTIVSAWLVTRDGLPLNVVKFWLALIGSQLLLLALASVAVLPPQLLAAIPVLRECRAFLGSAAQALPKALLFLLRRLPQAKAMSAVSEATEERAARGLLGDALTVRALFWRLVALTQRFAIGFNMGALSALWLIPYLDDPAFGWRSRLLDPATTASLASAIAAPWAWLYAPGMLSAEIVAATQYSSLDPALANLRGAEGPWSAWWPFLLCSLAFYGLLPRVFFLAFATWRGQRALARAPFGDADCQRLRARLEHIVVETRAEGEERGAPASGAASSGSEAIALRARRCVLVIAPGFSADRELAARIGQQSGAEIFREARPEDTAALAALAAGLRDDHPAEVVLLAVPAFEPPVGERLETLLVLREGLGAERLIIVVLEQPGGVEARHATVWRRALAARGDRYLDVLVASESDAAA